jgi:SAM-dependent methyltransferase
LREDHDVKSADWNRRYEGTELVWTAQPNRFLAPEVVGLAPGRVLDLACGEGRHAIWLAEQGWRAHGVDFSDVAIDKANRVAKARGVDAEFQVADLTEWDPAGEQWDLVLVFYLQLPAGERRVVLQTAAGAVAPGGTLLVVGHDSRNLEHGYGGPKYPEVLYTPGDVAADIEGSGLELERAEPVERTVETPEGERVAIDALIRARRAPRAS